MVDRISPRNLGSLIPGICEYVHHMAERDFAGILVLTVSDQ